jgi:hypothetical protein
MSLHSGVRKIFTRRPAKGRTLPVDIFPKELQRLQPFELKHFLGVWGKQNSHTPMSYYLDETYQIIKILQDANLEDVAIKFSNAIAMGGTHGERISIIVCLIKTYEISNPELFRVIETPARRLIQMTDELNYDIRANMDIFDILI